MITTGLFFLLNEFFIYNYYDNNLINSIFRERITCSIIVILSRKFDRLMSTSSLSIAGCSCYSVECDGRFLDTNRNEHFLCGNLENFIVLLKED